MTRPMIENSDRGITLNKSLAWTILSALVVLVWFGGKTITELQAATTTIAETVTDMRAQNDALEGRIRTVEQSTATSVARYESLSQSLGEVKAEVRQTNDLIRRLIEGRAE